MTEQEKTQEAVPYSVEATSAKPSRKMAVLVLGAALALASARSPSRGFEIVASDRVPDLDKLLGADLRRKATYPKAPKKLGPKPCAAKQYYRR